MVKHRGLIVLFIGVSLLLVACSPRPVKELNRTFSSAGIHMTATAMYTEPCPDNEGYLIVTTYFTVENTRRNVDITVESHYVIDDYTEAEVIEHRFNCVTGNIEIVITQTVPSDAVEMRYMFFRYRGDEVTWLSHFWLAISLSISR